MRLLLYGGKGGVGKTTCAAAAALAAAESDPSGPDGAEGAVLLVSTDPAHSLGDTLGVQLGPEPLAIETRSGALWALELDAAAALERWLAPRRQAVAEVALRGTYLDGEDVERLLDLSPPGVDELIGLAEVVRRAGELGCGQVVVDTAPTAHTLRLLAMPEALRRFAALLDALEDKHRLLGARFGGGHAADGADRMIAAIDRQGAELQALLRDPERTGFSWVTLAEPMALAETRDGLAALDAAGIPVREVIVNRLVPPGEDEERRAAQIAALEEAEEEAVLAGRVVRTVTERPREPRGLAALRTVAAELAGGGAADLPGRGGRGRRAASVQNAAGLSAPGVGARPPGEEAGIPAPIRDLLAPVDLRLLLFGGKGGVGKSTCAAAAALDLAAAGRRVLLISTDPAHSLSDVLGVPLGDGERPVPGVPGLTARELDSERAFERWRSRSGDGIDDALAALTGQSGLGAVLDPSREPGASGFVPPGLDEVVALVSLLDAVLPADGGPEAAHDLIVVDTAPTGHTLRLLALPELALAWDHALLSLLLKYREVRPPGPLASGLVELSRGLKRFSALLRDPARAAFVPVARPAELPVRESLRLMAELDRLAVPVPAVLVDAVAGREGERRWLEQLRAVCAGRCRRSPGGRRGCAMIVAPAVVPPPHGSGGLAQWGAAWRIDGPDETA